MIYLNNTPLNFTTMENCLNEIEELKKLLLNFFEISENPNEVNSYKTLSELKNLFFDLGYDVKKKEVLSVLLDLKVPHVYKRVPYGRKFEVHFCFISKKLF